MIDLPTLGALLVRAFVVVAMVSFGLQVTVAEISRLRHRPGLVVGALVVNLVFLPLAAAGLSAALGLDDSVAVALIVMATAAGSSYSIKLVEIADGEVATGLGLMFTLAVVTTFTLGPLVATLMRSLGSPTGGAVHVDAAAVLVSLVGFQLVPLVGLLALHERAPALASRLRGPSIRLASILLILIVGAVVFDYADELIALGPWPIVGMVALTGLGLLGGFAIAGRDLGTRRTLALITGQRSSATALLAVQSLAIPVATASVVAFSLSMLVINLGVAIAIRRRTVALATVRGPVPGREPSVS